MTHYPGTLVPRYNSSPSFSSPFTEVNLNFLFFISKARLIPVALVPVHEAHNWPCRHAAVPIHNTTITGVGFKHQYIYPFMHWGMLYATVVSYFYLKK